MPKHEVHHLTVRHEFGTYKRGDHIEDEAEVNRIWNSEQRHYVVRVAADVEDEKKPEAPVAAPPPPPPAAAPKAEVPKDEAQK